MGEGEPFRAFSDPVEVSFAKAVGASTFLLHNSSKNDFLSERGGPPGCAGSGSSGLGTLVPGSAGSASAFF